MLAATVTGLLPTFGLLNPIVSLLYLYAPLSHYHGSNEQQHAEIYHFGA